MTKTSLVLSMSIISTGFMFAQNRNLCAQGPEYGTKTPPALRKGGSKATPAAKKKAEVKQKESPGSESAPRSETNASTPERGTTPAATTGRTQQTPDIMPPQPTAPRENGEPSRPRQAGAQPSAQGVDPELFTKILELARSKRPPREIRIRLQIAPGTIRFGHVQIQELRGAEVDDPVSFQDELNQQ